MSESVLESNRQIEQESVLDFIRGVGSGFVKGVLTGAPLGPVGMVIGGVTGGTVGGVQTAQRLSSRRTPASAPPTPPPPSAPAPPALPGRPPAARGGSNLTPQILQQLTQFIPLLTAFLARQSAHAAPRVSARSGDSQEENFFEEPSLWDVKEESESGHSIEEPIPDEDALPMTEDLGESPPLPEYPLATRFVPARYYESRSEPRRIRQIVIHITDGGPKINGTISWFRNPIREGNPVEVSAHYIVGRDGEVVQMVRENDVAWHAGSANSESIGIEHNARAPRRGTAALYPTAAQYCSSAALVRWLCARYGIPLDRVHILGHAEADPSTRHAGCPDSVWNWDYHMSMVAAGACLPPSPGVTVGEQMDEVAEELLEDVAFRWSSEAVLDLADWEHEDTDEVSATHAEGDSF